MHKTTGESLRPLEILVIRATKVAVLNAKTTDKGWDP